MENLSRKVEEAFGLLRDGQYAEIGRRIGGRVYRRYRAYGLRRDLLAPFETPRARIPIAIRELQSSDIDLIFPNNYRELPPKEQKELEVRRAHLEANIPRSYVATDTHGTPCYVQWLMGPAENAKIQKFFGGRFPLLRPDEALLENAYTPLAFRSKGIMPSAMAMIAQEAKNLGVRYVVTFVEHDNVPSLKGCKKAGFFPYLLRQDTVYLGGAHRDLRFIPLPDGSRLPYERPATATTSL